MVSLLNTAESCGNYTALLWCTVIERDNVNLNRIIIEAAIIGFEAQKKQIDETISELRAQLGTPAPAKKRGRKPNIAEAAAAPTKPKRKMSAAGRKAIRDAVKRRWTAVRAKQQGEK